MCVCKCMYVYLIIRLFHKHALITIVGNVSNTKTYKVDILYPSNIKSDEIDIHTLCYKVLQRITDKVHWMLLGQRDYLQ